MRGQQVCRFAAISVVISTAVLCHSVRASQTIGMEWLIDHGFPSVGAEIGVQCPLGLKPVEPLVVGSEGRIEGKVVFTPPYPHRPTGGPNPHIPDNPMKIKLVWAVEQVEHAFISGEPIVDTEMNFEDTLRISTRIIPLGGRFDVACVIYLEDLRRVNWVSEDHWFMAGMGVLELLADPTNANRLLPMAEASKIRRKLRDDLTKRLRDADRGDCEASAIATSVVDSMLGKLPTSTRRQLAAISDFLASQTNTPVRKAATFVGEHCKAWGDPDDINEVQKGAQKVLEQDRTGLLIGFYHSWLDRLESPVREAWEYVRAARSGMLTWDEVEKKLDELLSKHPDDQELRKSESVIRDQIPEWRKRQGDVFEETESSSSRP